MDPQALSWALRLGEAPDLNRRRHVTTLSLIAAGAMGVISLYQMGVTRRVPDLPLKGLNAEKLNASPQAYSILQTPDAPLGLASYAGTMVLAAMGGPDRARTMPWVPLALAGKVAVDALVAAKLTADQATKYKAACLWCLGASAATFAMVPLVIPEAKEALRTLRRPSRASQVLRAASAVKDRVLAAR
jgi:uncharacterized membrane protein